MAKKAAITTPKPPCVQVKIGASRGASGAKTATGCAIVGTGSFDRKAFNLGRNYKATSKTVDALDGKTCGTNKQGKAVKCPAPCAAVTKRNTCPVQLAFDAGQPFLRFCRAAKAAGYRVDVTSPREAAKIAERACKHWSEKGSFEGFFPPGTKLR